MTTTEHAITPSRRGVIATFLTGVGFLVAGFIVAPTFLAEPFSLLLVYTGSLWIMALCALVLSWRGALAMLGFAIAAMWFNSIIYGGEIGATSITTIY